MNQQLVESQDIKIVATYTLGHSNGFHTFMLEKPL